MGGRKVGKSAEEVDKGVEERGGVTEIDKWGEGNRKKVLMVKKMWRRKGNEDGVRDSFRYE